MIHSLKILGLVLAMSVAGNANATYVACGLFFSNQRSGPLTRQTCYEGVYLYDCVRTKAKKVFGGEPRASRWDVFYARSCDRMATEVYE